MQSCPKCGSEYVHFNRRAQLYVCEDCGYTYPHSEKTRAQTIFFSYGHDRNEPIVLRIKSDLEQRGHKVWIDKAKIHAGDSWRREITKGLTGSSVVLSFLSEHSTRTPGVCLDELRIALSVKGGYIKTVLLESEEKVILPPTVSDVQWLDMSKWTDHFDSNEPIDGWYDSCFKTICNCVESPEATSFAGEIEDLRHTLNPNILDAKERLLLSKELVGRKWLLDMVNAWIHREDASRAMVLIAGPGFGKSCFAAHYLHYSPEAICGVFCEWDKPNTIDSRAVIKTIAFKAAAKIPDYRQLLMETVTVLGSRLDSMSASELFSALLATPLNMLIDGNRSITVIVLDGLDEAAQYHNGELANMLASQLNRLPPWIRFLITSRPENNVAALFRQYDPVVLKPDNVNATGDVMDYLLLSLDSRLGEVPNKLETVACLANKCDGNFLYASLIVDSIISGDSSLMDVAAYPPGIDCFYNESFARKYPTPESYLPIRNTLELIVASKVMPVQLLEQLNGNRYEMANFRQRMGSLLSNGVVAIGDARIKLESLFFCHKSILDWLVDPARSGRFFIDVRHGSSVLGDAAANILRKYGMQQLSSEALTNKNALFKCLESEIATYYSSGSNWDALESFLLDKQTPLLPYWRSISLFPEEWELNKLADRLSKDSSSLLFFSSLQRSGDTALALRLFNELEKNAGVSSLGIDAFKIYLDLLHLSGEYRLAVEKMHVYLSGYSDQQITSNDNLLAIQTRMLHHGKFFTPANEILDDTQRLLKTIDRDAHPKAYLELLISCGNLGTLSGDYTLAKTTNKMAMEYAEAPNRHDYLLRCLRKQADLLKAEGDYEGALEVLSAVPKTLNLATASRYELYLLYSRADIERLQGNFDSPYEACSCLSIEVKKRGIAGWLGHALLEQGALLYDSAFAVADEKGIRLNEAKARLQRAKEVYETINQEWGSICTRLYLASIYFNEGNEEAFTLLAEASSRAIALQYHSFDSAIASLKAGDGIVQMPLMFV